MNYLYPLGFFAAHTLMLTLNQSILYYHQRAQSDLLPWVGGIVFIGTLLQVIAFIVSGAIADRIYAKGILRKQMLLAVLVVYIISYCTIWLTLGWPHVLSVLIFFMASAVAMQLYLSILPSIAPDATVKQRLSMLLGLAVVIGVVCVIIVIPNLLKHTPFATIIYLMLAIFIFCYVLPVYFCKERYIPPQRDGVSPILTRSLWKRHALFTVLFINFLLNLALISVIITLPKFANVMLGRSTSHYVVLGSVFFLGALSAALSLAKSREPRVISYIAAATCLLGGLSIVTGTVLKMNFNIIFLPIWWLAFFAFGGMSVAVVTAINVALAMFSQKDALQTSGRLYSLNSAFFALGNGAGMLFSGSFLALGVVSIARSIEIITLFAGIIFVGLSFLITRDFYKDKLSVSNNSSQQA